MQQVWVLTGSDGLFTSHPESGRLVSGPDLVLDRTGAGTGPELPDRIKPNDGPDRTEPAAGPD